MDLLKAATKRLGALVGPTHRGMIDYFRFPERRDSWGGAFNGQQKRQELFVSLMQIVRPAAIIETGTFWGASTEFMANQSGLPIYSVEYDPRNFGFAKMRFRRNPAIQLFLGDSRSFLRKFLQAESKKYMDYPLFFYLDAHWGEDLPLSDEVEIIFSSWPQAIVMIDDFQVPGDEGYRYDDYGADKTLNQDYLASQVSKYQLAQFYPAARSTEESGLLRGCVVLVRDRKLIDVLSTVSLLIKSHDNSSLAES